MYLQTSVFHNLFIIINYIICYVYYYHFVVFFLSLFLTHSLSHTIQNNIPVFCPAITDGSLGDVIYFHTYTNPGFVIDLVQG